MRRMPGWIKRNDRQPTYLSASVRLHGGRKIPVVITDLSSDGCKVSCRQTLPVAEMVELSVKGGAMFRANVRWWIPGKAGLLFVEASADCSSDLGILERAARAREELRIRDEVRSG